MDLLLILIILLVLFWAGGFAFSIGSSLIHLLLVLAVLIFFVRLIQNRNVL